MTTVCPLPAHRFQAGTQATSSPTTMNGPPPGRITWHRSDLSRLRRSPALLRVRTRCRRHQPISQSQVPVSKGSCSPSRSFSRPRTRWAQTLASTQGIAYYITDLDVSGMEKLVKCPQIQSSSDMVSEVGSCRTEVVTYPAIKKIHDHQIHLWYPLLELPRPEAANRAYFA